MFVLMRHASGSWGAGEGPISSSSGGSDIGSPTAWALSVYFVGETAAIWRNSSGLENGVALPAADGNSPFIWSGAFDNTTPLYFVGVVGAAPLLN